VSLHPTLSCSTHDPSYLSRPLSFFLSIKYTQPSLRHSLALSHTLSRSFFNKTSLIVWFVPFPSSRILVSSSRHPLHHWTNSRHHRHSFDTDFDTDTTEPPFIHLDPYRSLRIDLLPNPTPGTEPHRRPSCNVSRFVVASTLLRRCQNGCHLLVAVFLTSSAAT